MSDGYAMKTADLINRYKAENEKLNVYIKTLQKNSG